MRPVAATLPAWALLGTGIAWREGEFSVVAISLVLVAWLLVIAMVAVGGRLRPPSGPEVRVVTALTLVAAVLLRPDRNMHAGGRVVVVQVLFAAAALAAVVSALPGLPGVAGRLGRRGAASVVALSLAAATGAVTIALVRDPDIDVWYLLQQSSDGLRHGSDMYRQSWVHSDGLTDVYPYLPGTTLLLAPFRWVFGDVRVGLLLAILLTVAITWRLGRARGVPPAVGLLLVLQPKWPWLVDQSWTEPLVLLLLAAAVLALDSDRPGAAMVSVAAALACKQHVVLLLPVLAMWPRFGWRRAAGAGVLAGAVALPWFVAGPRDFVHDAVSANLSLPVLARALCLPSLLDRWGVAVSFAVPLGGLLLAYALVWWRAPRTLSGLCLASALVMLTLDVLNKQSFYNHYSLVLGLLVLSVVTAQPPEMASSASQGTTRSSGSSSQPSGSVTRF